MDEKTIWNPTREVWIMVALFSREFVGMALEGRHDEICGENLGLHHSHLRAIA